MVAGTLRVPSAVYGTRRLPSLGRKQCEVSGLTCEPGQRGSYPQARFAVGGRSVELFRPSENALDWLRNIAGERPAENGSPSAAWAMFRRDPARQGRGSGGLAPLTQPVWRQAVSDHLELALALQAQRDEFFRGAKLAVPSLTPLAVDDIVVMRTTQRLVAVDFKTGKRLWQIDQPVPISGAATPVGSDDSLSSYWAMLKKRSWLDMSYGSISSDGRAVFVLERSGAISKKQEEASAPQQRVARGTDSVTPYNVLSAYELLSRQGQRIWSVGGVGNAKPPLDQLVFLGPPLPLDGQLYVIAEIVDAIHLVAFSPRSGELLWSQQLALIPPDRRNRPLHRIRGISPSFAAGILICPTGVGAVVAVDHSTRRLLWAHEYRAARPAGSMIDPSGTWTDSCAVISGRRVLITPAESLQMHCLDLLDGSHRWSLDRGNAAFLACVDRGVALVVGDRQLTAIELNTGRVAAGWPLQLPGGSLSDGRGGDVQFVQIAAAKPAGRSLGNRHDYFFQRLPCVRIDTMHATAADVRLHKAVSYDRGPVGKGAGVLTIGHFHPAMRSTHSDRMFRGLMDEVRLFGSSLDGTGALSLDEIRTIYRSTN